MEAVLQTRVPDQMAKQLKLYAITKNNKIKDCIAEAMTLFINQKPWLNGVWIKQPKTNSEFKPLTVKVPDAVSAQLTQTAEALEVSTSSLAYTAIEWYLKQNGND